MPVGRKLSDERLHPEGLTEAQERLALILFEAGVVQFKFGRKFGRSGIVRNPDLRPFAVMFPYRKFMI